MRVKWPITDARDVKHIADVVRAARGGWCRLGLDDGEVSSFEREWAKFQDAKYCLAVNNGTVAIECALQGVGLRPGDEVIVPSVTFIASASGVLMARGIPIFADMVPETAQIDAADVERRITSRTSGIVVVHYGGYPVDMTAIKKVAKKHGLFVLEDSAHAQGTAWKGRKISAIGDVGTFSFQGSKSLTSGEGGAIMTNRRDVYEACWRYHDIGQALRSERYQHEVVGPNLRLSELQGAILRTQLQKFPAQAKKRMATGAALSKGLKEIPGVEPLKEDKRVTARGYYFYVMRLDEEAWGVRKGTFIRAFNAEGRRIGSGYGRPVYHVSVFANNKYDATGWPVVRGKGYGRVVGYKNVCCPNAEKFTYHEQLTFGAHTLLDGEFAKDAVKIFAKLWENRQELQQYEKELAKAAR
jgi:dTDP-4-amino-4,6-dideoxygalactose transaminase